MVCLKSYAQKLHGKFADLQTFIYHCKTFLQLTVKIFQPKTQLFLYHKLSRWIQKCEHLMHAKYFGIFSSVNFGQGHWIVFQFIKFFLDLTNVELWNTF